MSKIRKPGKAMVELQPSRIRRDPPQQEKPSGGERKLYWAATSEREIWLAVIGIVGFALAINFLTYAISELTR